MKNFALDRVPDDTLLRGLTAANACERLALADFLAHLAAVDSRRLFARAGYDSMFTYLLGELHLSEDAALKRIDAARVARDFPAIFAAVAAGRLNLSAILMLAPRLTHANAPELIEAAAHKTRIELQKLLAERFPQPDRPTRVVAMPTGLPMHSGSVPPCQVAPGRPGTGERPKVEPLAPQRFALQFTIGQEAYDDLRRAQELLSHQVPSGDVAELFGRAIKLLAAHAERQKFAATSKPRKNPRRASGDPRQIPAHVKRAVRERDGDRCTFVSEGGHRCESRKFLEFDHVNEVARGGGATVDNLRLRCRAHNQYAAERAYGAEFMRQRRETARAERAAAIAERAKELDVIPWLRELGFKLEEARRAAELCEDMPDAPLEQRVKRALSYFATRYRTVSYAPQANAAVTTPCPAS